MGQEQRNEIGNGGGRKPDAPEGGHSPTGGALGCAVANGASGSLEPGQRWTATRKREVVLRVMRGESVDALSRGLGAES